LCSGLFQLTPYAKGNRTGRSLAESETSMRLPAAVEALPRTIPPQAGAIIPPTRSSVVVALRRFISPLAGFHLTQSVYSFSELHFLPLRLISGSTKCNSVFK